MDNTPQVIEIDQMLETYEEQETLPERNWLSEMMLENTLEIKGLVREELIDIEEWCYILDQIAVDVTGLGINSKSEDK